MLEIFEDNQTVEYNRSIYSIKGCKNGCIDGFYFDTKLGRKLPCEECRAKKKEIVLKKLKDKKDNKTILEKLNLPKMAKITDHLEDRNLIPDRLKSFYTEESLSIAKDEIIELYRKASGGQNLNFSYVFALPSYDIRYEDYISAIMLKMYSEGMIIAPFVYADELAKVDLDEQMGRKSSFDLDLAFYYKADVAVVCYSGTYFDPTFNFLLKFLNIRGNKYNKPTLVVLTSSLGNADGREKPSYWFSTDKNMADMTKPYCIMLEKRKDKEVQPKSMSPDMLKETKSNYGVTNPTQGKNIVRQRKLSNVYH